MLDDMPPENSNNELVSLSISGQNDIEVTDDKKFKALGVLRVEKCKKGLTENKTKRKAYIKKEIKIEKC